MDYRSVVSVAYRVPLFITKGTVCMTGKTSPAPAISRRSTSRIAAASRPQVGARPMQRRGALWTAHDRARSERRREQRDLNELAKLLGDPV